MQRRWASCRPPSCCTPRVGLPVVCVRPAVRPVVRTLSWWTLHLDRPVVVDHRRFPVGVGALAFHDEQVIVHLT